MSIKNSILWLLWSVLISCVSPSEQQANKAKLLEGLKDHQVVRVTEEQIMAAAFEEGQKVLDLIDSASTDLEYWNSTIGLQYLDSLNNALNHGSIKMVKPDSLTDDLGNEEMALLEAYLYSAEQAETLSNNVQRTADGQFLLYTSPITSEEQFLGMWSMYISKKTLIRNIE